MRIFLYEFLTGGGSWSWSCNEPPSGSLLREGAAMVGALAEDFLRIPGAEVTTLRDVRLAWPGPQGCRVEEISSADEEAFALERCSRRADWTLLIAPEIGGSLLDRCRRVESVGGRLLSPGSPLVGLASDKHRTAVHLASAGVPAPRRRGRRAGADITPRGVSVPRRSETLRWCRIAGSPFRAGTWRAGPDRRRWHAEAARTLVPRHGGQRGVAWRTAGCPDSGTVRAVALG